MKINIRTEEVEDHEMVFELISKAFKNEAMSDHREQFLVKRLRKSNSFVPELSIIAEIENEIIGHILLSEVKIKTEHEELTSLALAPISVLPSYQGRGVGGRLIKEAHQRAKDLDYKSIALLGHETYYPRFGYQRASEFGITFPFDAPSENCMLIELEDNALDKVKGTIVYPPDFFEY